MRNEGREQDSKAVLNWSLYTRLSDVVSKSGPSTILHNCVVAELVKREKFVAIDGMAWNLESHGVGVERIIWFNLAQAKLVRHWQLVGRMHTLTSACLNAIRRVVGHLASSGVNVEGSWEPAGFVECRLRFFGI